MPAPLTSATNRPHESRLDAVLPDFRWVALEPLGARQVAGFGAARSVAAADLKALLQAAPPAPHA